MDDYDADREIDLTALGEGLNSWFSGHFSTHAARLAQGPRLAATGN